KTLDLPPTQPIPIPQYLPPQLDPATAAPPYVPARALYETPVPPPAAGETYEPTDAASPAARRAARERTAGPFPWKEAALAGLAVYALVMTVIAVVGWTRKPATVPAPTVHQPTTSPTL